MFFLLFYVTEGPLNGSDGKLKAFRNSRTVDSESWVLLEIRTHLAGVGPSKDLED